MHITYRYIAKHFSTLIINSNNDLYYNIFVYKLNPLINIMILKILISKTIFALSLILFQILI